jgi:serine/threonine protein kinase
MFTPGMKMGVYEVTAALGARGVGKVYRARDTRLVRDVALKVLPAEFAHDPSRRMRFEGEARSVAALNHPNIVVLYDIGTQDGVVYIVSAAEARDLLGADTPLHRLYPIEAPNHTFRGAIPKVLAQVQESLNHLTARRAGN